MNKKVEETSYVGANKKKKNRKNKQKKNQAVQEPKLISDENTINMNVDILRTFALIKIQPPEKPDDIPTAVEKLEKLADAWEIKGQDELDAGEHDEEHFGKQKREN